MGKPLDITSQRQMTSHVSKWLHWHPTWLSNAGTPRKHPESQRLAEDSQERNPIIIKPKTVSHVAQQSSWVPAPSCPPPGGPLANQVSCLVSTGVSWDNSFPSVTREPPLKPWKGSPFLQKGDTQYWTAIRRARTVGGEFGEEWIHVYE